MSGGGAGKHTRSRAELLQKFLQVAVAVPLRPVRPDERHRVPFRHLAGGQRGPPRGLSRGINRESNGATISTIRAVACDTQQRNNAALCFAR